jgi:hypothetical protein
MNVLLPLLLSVTPVNLAQVTPAPPASPAPPVTPAPTSTPTINTVCGAVAISGRSQYIYVVRLSPDGLRPASVSILKQTGSSSSPILRNGSLTSYEEDAPDADYSFPPFDPEFRGEPNNGKWIYWYRGSVHGLYVSALPKDSAVQRIQVVHFLSRNGSIKSSPDNCRRTS